MAELPKPGWYRDPAEPSVQRWWDGEQWLGGSIPADATPPDGPLPVAAGTVAAGTVATGTAATGTAAGAAATAATASSPAGPSQVAVPPGSVPPGSVAAAVEQRPGGGPSSATLAPLGARVLARLLDILAVLALNVVVNGYFVVQYVREVGPTVNAYLSAAARGEQPPALALSDEAGRLYWTIKLIAIGLWFAYEVPAIANSGQTLGKRLLRIRVARLADGAVPSFGQSFHRWILLALPSPLLAPIFGFPLQLLDLLWCTWDRPARQCLHDKAVTSIVVRAEPTEPTPPAP